MRSALQAARARVLCGRASFSSSRLLAGGSNPLLAHGALPRFEEIEAEHVKPAVEAALAQLRDGFRSAETRLSLSAAAAPAAEVYAIAVDDVERAGAPLQFAWGVASH